MATLFRRNYNRNARISGVKFGPGLNQLLSDGTASISGMCQLDKCFDVEVTDFGFAIGHNYYYYK